MIDALRLHSANDDAGLYERFAERTVNAATSRGLPPLLVAGALLSKCVAVLIDELGADQTAELLVAVAVRASPAPTADGDDAV